MLPLDLAAFRILAPPPRLTVSEWADRERMLSAESSAEPGRWDTSRAPYQRGMMDALNEPGTQTVVIMTGAQIGKTEALNNVIGFFISQDPSPILLLQPTLEMAEAWSKDRLAPMLRDTPALRGKVKDATARASGNTLLHKTFPGGHITMAGANSPASLASRPIRVVLADEVDRYPVSAGTEGDPISLAEKRQATFWNRKLVMTSTPTVKGASRIEMAFDGSDQRRYWVPCPHCEGFQTLKWSQVTFDKENPRAAVYACEHCGAEIHDHHKPKMLDRGEWRKGKPGLLGTAGFHLNELYSPWRGFGQIAADFLEKKRGGAEQLRVFINTTLGETWEDRQGESISADGLMKRREAYTAVPQGAAVLTAGVDVQADRLEVSVRAWGRGEESWLVAFRQFHGDPTKEGVWESLDGFLSGRFEHASGAQLTISATAVDSGFLTADVYRFCRPRIARRVWAIKGVAGTGKPAVGRPTRNNRAKIAVFPVGVDTLKDLLFARLRGEIPGPGYLHFPEWSDTEYFEQLAAEKVVTRYQKGFPTRVYEKIRPRNEAIDLEVYALAAYYALNIQDIGHLVDQLNPEIEATEAKETQPERQENRWKVRKNTGKAWGTGWKR